MINVSSLKHVALLSVHTSPLAPLGQKKTGGMNVYVRDFSRELARRGVQVDIFTRAIDPEAPQVLLNLGHGCRVVQLPAGPLSSMPNDDMFYHLDEFAAGVHHFARTEGIRYDVIHSHYWLSGVVAGKLRQLWGPTPLIHMYHTLGHMKNMVARDDRERSAPVRLIGEAYVANIADQLIAATPAEEAQLIELYRPDPERVTVIPPGVDLTRFAHIPACTAKRRIGLAPEQRVILAVGRVEPLKGLDTLLQATAWLRQQNPDALANARVMLVGGDPHQPDAEMARLLAMRTELGLDALVNFAGAKDQSILPSYYAAADMVVLPSHYESFGMVAIEAMAMGVPVIASRVGGLAHLVKDQVTGLHIRPQEPRQLAQKMELLLTDEPRRQRLAAQARAYAKSYQWPLIVDRMQDVYASVMDAYLPVFGR